MVKINAGHHRNIRILQRGSTKDALVLADFGPDPVPSEIKRIRKNRLLPGLKCNVGVSLPRVLESVRWGHRHILSSVSKLILVVEKLPMADESRFVVRQPDGVHTSITGIKVKIWSGSRYRK